MANTGGVGHFHRWREEPRTYSTKWDPVLRELLAVRPKRPVLAWGHDFVSEEAVEALHAHGCHVVETWPGDALATKGRGEHVAHGGASGNEDAIRRLAEATQCRQWDGRPLVLLVSDVDRICCTGRAMLKQLFAPTKPKGKKPKRKRGEPPPSPPRPPPLRIVCTCSDYHAPSLKTAMHGLVPKSAALQLSGRPTSVHTPWDSVNAVRARPPAPEVGPDGRLTERGQVQATRQAEADQILREDTRVLATLVKHAYSLKCVAARPGSGGPPTAAAPWGNVEDPSGVSDHLSACDLLASLAERKRKLHEDDDDPALSYRPGDDPYTAALATGLALRDQRAKPQYLDGAFPAAAARPSALGRAAMETFGGSLRYA